MWRRESKRAARLRLCRLAAAAAWVASLRGAALQCAGVATVGAPGGRLAGASAALGDAGLGGAVPMRPLQRLICFCKYLRWFTFRLDLPGLSSASLMLLDAESMKLSRSRVASRTSPPSDPDSSAPAVAPLSSSSKQQPLSRLPKALTSPSAEPPKPKGMKGCELSRRSLHRHLCGSPAVRSAARAHPARSSPGEALSARSDPGSRLSLPGELIRSCCSIEWIFCCSLKQRRPR
uniref:Uncharacterized protein n=1 Tax=Mus musculus TaxID=10090 RepID=Q8C8E6_MOUSE|nr:unnamed protein product [Mus musculus]